MMPFVGVALKVCEKLEILDKSGQGIVMKFSKMYTPEKMGEIMREAQKFNWWRSNPKAAFMKAVGVVNKLEKKGIVNDQATVE